MPQDWFDTLPTSMVYQRKEEKEEEKEKKHWFDELETSGIAGQKEKDWFFNAPTTEVVGGTIKLPSSHEPKKPSIIGRVAKDAGLVGKSLLEGGVGALEGAAESALDLGAFIPGLAVTLGAQAITGSHEKGEQIGSKFTEFVTGLYDPQTDAGHMAAAPVKEAFAKLSELIDYVGEEYVAPGSPEYQAALRTGTGVALVVAGGLLKGKAKTVYKTVLERTKNVKQVKIILKRSKSVPKEIKSVIDKIPDETQLAPEIQNVVKEAKQPNIALSKKQAEVFKRMPDEQVRQMADHGVEGAKIEVVERTVKAKETAELKAQQDSLSKELTGPKEGPFALSEEVGKAQTQKLMDIKEELNVREPNIAAKDLPDPPPPPQGELPFKGESPGQRLPQPEAGGQAYGQELPTKVGNIRIDKLDSTYDIKKALVDIADTYKQKGFKQKRGKQSWEESARLARNKGMTVEGLMKTKKGTAMPAEDIYAAQEILGGMAEDLFKKQAKYRADPSDANLISATVALERAGMISTVVTGVKGESGRALGIQRKAYKPGELKFEAMERILKDLGGREKNQEIIARMMSLDWDNPLAINKFVREVTKVKFSDKAFELWVNGLLSGPPTHIVNSVSTAVMGAEKPLITAIAAGIEAPKRLMGKKPKVLFGEVPAEIFSFKSGLRSGVAKASFALANEMTMGGATKMEVRVPTAIKGKKGEAARVSGRFLMTEDEFFKAIIYEADIHAKAYRKATNEGLKGAEKNKKIAELITDPTDGMILSGREEMLSRSFQKPLGKYGRKLQGLVQGIPGLRYVVPFLRVSLNIPKEAFRRTPLNIPRIAIKGAKGTLKGEALSREIAMAGIGTLASIVVFDMAMDGLITGGAPEDQSEKAAFYREGKQEYSVKVGDKYYSYARVEPIATIVGIAADATDVWKYATEEEKDKLASKIIGMVTENVTNKTFMRGVSTMMRAFSDPERWGDYAVDSLTGTAVPTGVAYAAKALDPVMRDAKGIIDNIKSRIPGLSKSLPAQRDIWGREKTREGGAAFQMISPIWMSTEKATPVDKELERLNLFIGAPNRSLGERKLTKQEYDVMSKDIGEDLYKTLSQVLSSSGYTGIDDDEAKIRVIKSIVSSIRRRGRDKYREFGIVVR